MEYAVKELECRSKEQQELTSEQMDSFFDYFKLLAYNHVIRYLCLVFSHIIMRFSRQPQWQDKIISR